MSTQINIVSQVTRLNQWLRQDALPLWSGIGINPKNGSAYEKLHKDGLPDKTSNLRTRVQTRQIFVFSAAHEMDWLSNGKMLVDGVVSFLESKAVVKKTYYAHLLSHDAHVIDSKCDTYDLAFTLLACAYRYKVFKDEYAKHSANYLLHYLDSHLKGHSAGYLEGNYHSDVRRQNPHMHLFEAFLTWHDISGEGKWLAKAGQIYSIFESTFFDWSTLCIREYFSSDWRSHDAMRGDNIEPGHMFEWVWLLRWYQELSGTPVDIYCDNLYRKGLAIGCPNNAKVVHNQVTPCGEIINGNKRLWPLTELIKACFAQAKAHPRSAAKYELKAAEAIDALFEFYFNKNVTGNIANSEWYYTGAYIDEIDLNNTVSNSEAPASTMYHIVMAAIEGNKYLNKVIAQ